MYIIVNAANQARRQIKLMYISDIRIQKQNRYIKCYFQSQCSDKNVSSNLSVKDRYLKVKRVEKDTPNKWPKIWL